VRTTNAVVPLRSVPDWGVISITWWVVPTLQIPGDPHPTNLGGFPPCKPRRSTARIPVRSRMLFGDCLLPNAETAAAHCTVVPPA
jgi:hypothetical protein